MSALPLEQTDSLQFASGFQFLNLRGFEHLLPLLTASIHCLPLLILLFPVPEGDIFIPW